MAYKIAFFGAKPYDIASFDKINERYEFDIRYYKGHLNINNVVLTQGVDAVCIFVNGRCRCNKRFGCQWCETVGASLRRF